MAKCILIVDDEPHVLKFLSFRLERLGYDIRTAVDGQKAMESVREKKPDLMFLDLRIPIMNGYEVCRQIKADPELKSIPVIFLTADANVKTNQDFEHVHADGFIVKPFDQEEISKQIDKFLKPSKP